MPYPHSTNPPHICSNPCHFQHHLMLHYSFKLTTSSKTIFLSFLYQDLIIMSESKTTHEMGFQEHGNRVLQVFTEAKEDVNCNYNTMESDLDIDSLESSSSTERIEEDVSSSSSSPCSPLFHLSDLMAHLPIKRGISKFYQGRSESFASLTSVKSVEDLAKKDKYWCRSRRSMKRYGQSQRLSAKGTIGKNKKGSSSTMTKSSAFSSLGNISSLTAT